MQGGEVRLHKWERREKQHEDLLSLPEFGTLTYQGHNVDLVLKIICCSSCFFSVVL